MAGIGALRLRPEAGHCTGSNGTAGKSGDVTMSFSIILSVGKYGGFYLQNGHAMKRICLGWIAITAIVPEFDETFYEVMRQGGQEI